MAQLYTKQIKIIQYIQRGLSSDRGLSKILKLDKPIVHEYVEDLIQKRLVINRGSIEIDNQGYEEYLTLSLDTKGIIYLDYLNNSDNTLVSFPDSLSDMHKSKIVNDFDTILNLLNQTGQYTCDTEIEELLEIDLDMIQFCLQEMAKEELVKLVQESNYSSDPESCAAKITNKGKLVLKQSIPFEYNLPAKQNNPITVHGNINNIQNHSGNGNNIGRDKNINNIHESPKLTQTIKEIQAVLEKLEQTYNPNTTTGKMTIATKAIEHIEQDRNLAKRVLSAIEKGGIGWLQAKLINPSASFLVAALEDWQKTKQ